MTFINDHWSLIIDIDIDIDIAIAISIAIDIDIDIDQLIIYHFHKSFRTCTSSGRLVDAGGSGGLAPQQIIVIWPLEIDFRAVQRPISFYFYFIVVFYLFILLTILRNNLFSFFCWG